jgi:hypothetical protein
MKKTLNNILQKSHTIALAQEMITPISIWKTGVMVCVIPLSMCFNF